MFVPEHAVVQVCRAILELFRDEGSRKDRNKNRLMWLIDDFGLESFRCVIDRDIEDLHADIPFYCEQHVRVCTQLFGVHCSTYVYFYSKCMILLFMSC
jgi:sulfite reductase beta subunit-like hemoprotein